MKVILIEPVPSLGKAGDVVQVAVGFARNFLIPKKLALESTPANMQLLERQRESFLGKLGKEKKNAQDLADKIGNLSFTLARPSGESEKLFGSVTSMDLQKLLAEQGILVDRRKIILSAPIKHLGSLTIPVKLHPEVVAEMKITIVPVEADSAKS